MKRLEGHKTGGWIDLDGRPASQYGGLIESSNFTVVGQCVGGEESEAGGEAGGEALTMGKLAEDWSCGIYCEQEKEEEEKQVEEEEGGGDTDQVSKIPADGYKGSGMCSSHKECEPDSRCFLQQGRCVNMDTSDLLGMLQQLQREQKEKKSHQSPPSDSTVLW